MKALSESFDRAQDERRGIDNTDDAPFTLRLSKHSEMFSAAGLSRSQFEPDDTGDDQTHAGEPRQRGGLGE